MGRSAGAAVRKQAFLMGQLFTVRREGPPLSNYLFLDSHLGSGCQFKHTFGGLPRHRGVTPPDFPKPWHLLFTLDLTDPRIELEIPGIRWLSLYNPFNYDSPLIQYRLASDSEVQLVYQGGKKFTPDFPYEGFPEYLPSIPVHVCDAKEVAFADDKEEAWWELYCDEGDGPELQKRKPNRNELCGLDAGIHQGVGLTECMHCGC